MTGSLGRSFQSEVLVDGVALVHDLAAVPLRVRFHVGIKPLGGTGKVSVGLAPNLVSVKKGLRAGVDSLGLLTAFFEELQAQIVVTLVLVDHLPHGGGHFQTETLVLEIPGDQPSENALHGFLCLELVF